MVGWRVLFAPAAEDSPFWTLAFEAMVKSDRMCFSDSMRRSFDIVGGCEGVWSGWLGRSSFYVWYLDSSIELS